MALAGLGQEVAHMTEWVTRFLVLIRLEVSNTQYLQAYVRLAQQKMDPGEDQTWP
jgi:hypothetical protein